MLPQKKTQNQDASPHNKRLGNYLVEAGLLTLDQVNVALADQEITGMRFGEIIVVRGWIKEQTVEYFMEKVILPERQPEASPNALVPRHLTPRSRREDAWIYSSSHPYPHSSAEETHAPTPNLPKRGLSRKTPPITKPLPSVNSIDSDISWVG